MKRNKPCFECGQQAEHNHHIVPKSRGGTKTVPLCTTCHSLAHNEGENLLIKTLHKGRIQAKKAAGEWVYGRERYGFTKIDGKAVPLPHEQWVITAIYDLFILGYGYSAIARVLNAANVPRREGIWLTNQVWRLLKFDSR